MSHSPPSPQLSIPSASPANSLTRRRINPFFTVLGIAGLIIAAVMVFKFMKATAPQPKETPVIPAVPHVRIYTVKKMSVTLEVHTQGVVEPRTQTELIAEVSGRILQVSPSMKAGGFFKKGDLLLQMDPSDYETALSHAIAEVARTEAEMATEQAEAQQARRDWKRIKGDQKASDLLLRIPQLAKAEAALASARAAVNKAHNDLKRSSITAPYDGRSRKEMAEIGQFAGVGTPLGTIYATDYVEVRLPLSDEQIGKLNPELLHYHEGEWKGGPEVHFSALVAGKRHTWKGHLTRLEGAVDEKTRFYYAVGRINDPYGIEIQRQMPLTIGMFVDALITGRRLENIAEIPRMALHPGNTVYVVNHKNCLHMQQVEVVSAGTKTVYVGSGLGSGDRIIISPLALAMEGMPLSIETQEDQTSGNPSSDPAPPKTPTQQTGKTPYE